MKQLPSYEEAKAMRNNSNQNSSLLGRLGGAIIHLLGGITKEECAAQSQQSYDEGRLMSFTGLKLYADSMNGYNADDWCKLMYAHILGCIKHLEEEAAVPDASASVK